MKRWSPTRMVPSMEAVGTTEASPTKIRMPRTIQASTIRRRVVGRLNLCARTTGAVAVVFLGSVATDSSSGVDASGDLAIRTPEAAEVASVTDSATTGRSHSSSESIKTKEESLLLAGVHHPAIR